MRLFRASVAALAFALAGALGLSPSSAAAQEAVSDGLRIRVVELAQSVDLSRGKERFLTVTVELSAADPVRLRRVQPLRDDFTVLAGKAMLPCRWLRGGSLPEDPTRLRFTLGFSLPPPGTARVALQANLPRLDGGEALELRLDDLSAGQTRKGPGWTLTVQAFSPESYDPPAVPPKGTFISKLGPVDARVFRKQSPKAGEPDRAVLLRIHSEDTALYDPILDVSGNLLVDGRPGPALLSARMLREPSRTVEKPPAGPFVRGEFYFPVPAKGRPTGAVIRLHRRGAGTEKPVLLRDLPVPSV
ncbi:MAG: hypothetical protein ACK47B_16620 [Armatimonadota bacterium]